MNISDRRLEQLAKSANGEVAAMARGELARRRATRPLSDETVARMRRLANNHPDPTIRALFANGLNARGIKTLSPAFKARLGGLNDRQVRVIERLRRGEITAKAAAAELVKLANPITRSRRNP